MPRCARIKQKGGGGWYHLYCRVSAKKGEYPLDSKQCRHRFVSLLKWLSKVYCCQIAGFCIMGNHYHLVVRFDDFEVLDRAELRRRAEKLYPKGGKMLDGWLSAKWERFNERIFDVSELMRQVQSAYARWFNRAFERRGRLWGDRFKSTLLEDKKQAVECLLYAELNPVRAGIAARPEEHEGSSLYLREAGDDRWMMRLSELTGIRRRSEALIDYRARVYYRGNVPSKERQKAIPDRVIREEEARGFASKGLYRKRLRYFVDGLAMGSEEYVREQIDALKRAGIYLRRKNPIKQGDMPHLTLREQRSHAV